VSAVQRTLQTLELLAEVPEGLAVGELVAKLGADKSIVSRLLSTLQVEGYAVRDPASDRYALSLRLLSVALKQADTLGFPGVCAPILRRLAAETGELIELTVADEGRLVYVASAEGRQRLNIRPTMGREVTLHATATGKAWLSTLPLDLAVTLALDRGLTAETPHTITNLPALLRELDRVRKRGYATVRDEWFDGICAIAVAIGIRRFGHAVGVVVLAAPTSRYNSKVLEAFAPGLRRGADDLEAVWPLDVVRERISQSSNTFAAEQAL
jgi:IclR family transcriptional regulator, acetate operon repressor